MAVDFKTFNSFVGMIADSHFPIMIRGRHGIGKSELVYQFANKRNLPVVERRASQMTEGDLVGLPVIDGDTTAWNPPDWYKQACREAVVLFMDEIDRATTEVRQGFFQLADSRTLNGHRLHPETILFAAVNGGVHAAQYQVNDMDPAELDRWTVFDVEPSVEDWISYAGNNGVNAIVVDFIRHNRLHLENTKDFEPGKVYPSRRSWERLSKTINANALLEGEHFKSNLNAVYNLASGFVGFEAAVALRDFAEKYENQVTVEDILEGRIDRTAGWKLNDHVAMVDKLLTSGKLTEDMPNDHLDNLCRYFIKLPAEAAMKFYTNMSVDKNLLKFILRFQRHTVDGIGVKPHMTTMLAKSVKK